MATPTTNKPKSAPKPVPPTPITITLTIPALTLMTEATMVLRQGDHGHLTTFTYSSPEQLGLAIMAGLTNLTTPLAATAPSDRGVPASDAIPGEIAADASPLLSNSSVDGAVLPPDVAESAAGELQLGLFQ
jgi:hypothetical protein